ncbi:hypothetical protein KQX54_005860 [Cotesia glomerata]|uniref:Uncharacterized protein n=1 Tax=Cotesia glomerata TaxID=32391 RepID=A0AAV7J2L7_COTGL|nr:hypothetical protein KQX54_005860 [Cotesia glomerata]
MRIILAENHRWDRHSVRGIIEPTSGNQEPLTSFTCILQSSTVLGNSLMPKLHHSPARTPGDPTAQNTLIRPSCYSGSFISHPLIQSPLCVYFISVQCQSFPDGNPIYFFTRK